MGCQKLEVLMSARRQFEKCVLFDSEVRSMPLVAYITGPTSEDVLHFSTRGSFTCPDLYSECDRHFSVEVTAKGGV